MMAVKVQKILVIAKKWRKGECYAKRAEKPLNPKSVIGP